MPFNPHRFSVIAAGLCGLLAAVPAGAQDSVPVRAQVKAGDLNLRSPQGRATLNQRVRSAAKTACSDTGTGRTDLASAQDSSRCQDQMVHSGNVQANGIAAQQKAAALKAEGGVRRHPMARKRVAHHRPLHHRRHPVAHKPVHHK